MGAQSTIVQRAPSAPLLNRSRFVAFRSSRHRIAALALYRSLLRSANKITVSGAVQEPAAVDHPVTQLVRKRFAKAKAYDSSRLVFAAMTAGYKFLGLFTKAQAAGSAEHAQVLSYLDGRRQVAHASRDANDPLSSTKPIRRPSENRIPFLARIERPGEAPDYAPSNPPTPKEALKGKRHIPRLAATADGLPFLRFKKPQPVALTRFLRQKTDAYKKGINEIVYLEEEENALARLEDEWDYLVEQQLREQAGKSRQVRGDIESTFSWTAQVARLWWEWKVEKMWEDWMARGNALHKIIKREEVLVAQENMEAERQSDSHTPPNVQSKPISKFFGGSNDLGLQTRTNAVVDTETRSLPPLGRRAEHGGPTPEETLEPHNSRAWRGIVGVHNHRLQKKAWRELKTGSIGHEMAKAFGTDKMS